MGDIESKVEAISSVVDGQQNYQLLCDLDLCLVANAESFSEELVETCRKRQTFETFDEKLDKLYLEFGQLKEGETGVMCFVMKWIRLAPNGTNLGLLNIIFQYILAR